MTAFDSGEINPPASHPQTTLAIRDAAGRVKLLGLQLESAEEGVYVLEVVDRNSDPFPRYRAITPADADLPDLETFGVTGAIYVGAAGNLAILGEYDEDPVVFVISQGWHPIRAKRVLAATTATGLIACYK